MKKFKTIQYIIVGVTMFSIVMYLFPPVFKSSENRPLVLIFLLMSTVLLYLGLLTGYKVVLRTKKPVKKQFKKSFIKFLLLFYSLTFLLKYGYLMGLSPFDFAGMIGRVALGLADPALGYQLSLDEGVSPVPWSIFFLISVVNDFFFVLFFCVWKRLSKIEKTVVIFFVVIDIFYWLGRGTNFGIITMITNVLFVYLLNREESLTKNRKRVKSNIRAFAIIGLAAIASIFVFSYLMVGRTGEGDADQSLKNIESSQQIDYNSFVVRNLPNNLIAPYYFIYSYTCQGYENLGRAMNCDFHWCYLMGNNPRLMSLGSFFTGYNAMKDSYMVELERKYHVDSQAAWHSAYLWWANDVTIPGSLLIVFLLAFFCGCALAYSFRDRDVLSMIIAVALCNILLFLFANNTYLALMFYSFMFVFPYWIYTRLLRN